jgi:hypothetical protein
MNPDTATLERPAQAAPARCATRPEFDESMRRAAALRPRRFGGSNRASSVNAAVVGGASVAQALALGIFLEDAARIELLALGRRKGAPALSDAQAAQRAPWEGRVAERLWE